MPVINPLITIVIPVYNVEKYLDRCLRSVVNQTYHNLDILLVDDGSPDRCPQMCEEWAHKDSRIRVIHKENGGLGMARNTGIENAAGDYICFFDSDDYIAPDTIELAYEMAREEKVEMVLFGMAGVSSGEAIVESVVPTPSQTVYRGAEVQEKLLPGLLGPDPVTGSSFRLSLSACRILVSMKLIRRANWRFVSEREIISEDFYSLLALYKDVQSAAVVCRALYYYCCNDMSLTHLSSGSI